MSTQEQGRRNEGASQQELDRAIDVTRLGLTMQIAPYAAEYLGDKEKLGEEIAVLPERHQAAFMEGAVYAAVVSITGEKSDEGGYTEGSTKEYRDRVTDKLGNLLNWAGVNRENEKRLVPVVQQAGRVLKDAYYLGKFTPKAS